MYIEHETFRARGSTVGLLEVPGHSRCLVAEVWGSAEDGVTLSTKGFGRAFSEEVMRDLTVREEEDLNQEGSRSAFPRASPV